jgi:hypothetical protein
VTGRESDYSTHVLRTSSISGFTAVLPNLFGRRAHGQVQLHSHLTEFTRRKLTKL